MLESFVKMLASFGLKNTTIIVVIIAILITMLVLVSRPCIKIGKSYISFGRYRGKRPHENCPFSGDFFSIIAKTTEIITKICDLNTIRMMERQMNYVEQKLMSIKSFMMQNYSKLLIEKIGKTEITSHEDFIIYSRLIESLLMEDIKQQVKRAIVENSFSDLTETEFKVYVKEKFEYLYQLGGQFMDLWYVSNKMVVSREEIRVSMGKLKLELIDYAYDVFRNAITIKNEIENEKKRLQAELDNFCNNIIGTKERKMTW